MATCHRPVANARVSAVLRGGAAARTRASQHGTGRSTRQIARHLWRHTQVVKAMPTCLRRAPSHAAALVVVSARASAYSGQTTKGKLMNLQIGFHAGRVRWALMAVLALATVPASAAISIVAQYSLGEADAGAAAGAVASSTTPSVGSTSLAAVGTPRYANTGAPAPRPSRLSVAFNGTADGLRAAGVISSVTDNFGVEAWVYPTSTAGTAQIAYNGNSSTTGWGLFRNGTSWAFLYGGNVLQATAAPSVDLNRWTHLALVRSAGTTTLYKNGVAVATSPTGPNAPAGAFAIGINPLAAGEFFAGSIDEVRIFTFAAGQFATSDLQTGLSYTDPPAVVPVNAPMWLLTAVFALIAVGVGVIRSRRSL